MSSNLRSANQTSRRQTHICEAGKKAMDDGHTHYTPATGLPATKEAICAAFERDYGIQL